MTPRSTLDLKEDLTARLEFKCQPSLWGIFKTRCAEAAYPVDPHKQLRTLIAQWVKADPQADLFPEHKTAEIPRELSEPLTYPVNPRIQPSLKAVFIRRCSEIIPPVSPSQKARELMITYVDRNTGRRTR